MRNVKGAGKDPKGRVSPAPTSCVLRLAGRGHGWRVQRKVREISQPESLSGYRSVWTGHCHLYTSVSFALQYSF